MPDSLSTVVDLGDKALDLLETAVNQVSQLIQQAAPELWRMTAEKLWAVAWTEVWVSFPIVIISLVTVCITVHIGRKCEWKHGGPYVAGLVIGVVTFGVSFGFMLDGIIHLILYSRAADYYVLQEIIKLTVGR